MLPDASQYILKFEVVCFLDLWLVRRCSGFGSANGIPECVNMTHRKIVSYRAFVEGKYGDAVNVYGAGHGTHVVGCVGGGVVSGSSEWGEVSALF